MSLFDFEQAEPPVIVRETAVHHPDPERSEVIGWTGTWANGTCYVSIRSREEHFFRKLEGYAISEGVLATLLARPVQTVFIAEKDTGTVYEFDRTQFEDGTVLAFDGYDQQRMVPVADARRDWTKDQVTIK